MAWVKLDDSMPHHPKTVKAGPMAYALDVAAISYSNRFGLDGMISPDVLPAVISGIPNILKVVARLVAVDRWHEPGHDCERCPQPDEGWRIHDIEDFQPTAADQAELSRKRAEAGRAGGKQSGKQRRSKNEASASPGLEAKTNPVPTRPDPTPNTPASSLDVYPPPDHDRKRKTDLPALPRDIHDEAHAHQLPIDAYWSRVQHAVDRHRRDGAAINDPTAFGVHLVRTNDPLLRAALVEHQGPPVATVTDLLERIGTGKTIDEALA